MAEGDTVSSTTTLVRTRPSASHPPFIQMVIDGIQANPHRKGASIPSIKNYIAATYPTMEPSLIKRQLKKALAKAEEQGIIVRPKGTEEMKGAVGRFRLDKAKLAEINKPKKPVKEVKKSDPTKKVPTAKAASKTGVKSGTKAGPKSMKSALKDGAKAGVAKKSLAAAKTKTPAKQAAEKKAKKLVKAAMTPSAKAKAPVKPKQPKSKTAVAAAASKKKSPVAKKAK